VDERSACALLKQRFEAAGFTIEDNRTFDEDGIRFEIDGFDPHRRVGYEYLTEEAGDSWDVDEAVIAALEERRQRGDLHILIIDETHAPDPASVATAADTFLADLRARGITPAAPPSAAPAAPSIAPSDTPAPTRSKTSKPKSSSRPRSKSTKKKPSRK
jgi:hypothetical protein